MKKTVPFLLHHAAPLLLGAVCVVLLPANLRAQQNPGGGLNRGGGIQRPQPKNFYPQLKTELETLAKRTSAKLLIDPTLFIAEKPATAPAEGTIDAGLDALVGNMKGVAWRRVYLTNEQANAMPSAVKMAATLRALDVVEQSGLVTENTATKRATTILKNYPVTDGFKQDLAAGQFSTVPVYVVYSTSASSGTMQDRMADLQRQQMELMMQMSPEQMTESMAKGMDMWISLDPNMRMQMMGSMMRGGMQMFMNLSPEQRQQFTQEMMQIGQQLGGGFPGAPGGGGGRKP